MTFFHVQHTSIVLVCIKAVVNENKLHDRNEARKYYRDVVGVSWSEEMEAKQKKIHEQCRFWQIKRERVRRFSRLFLIGSGGLGRLAVER